MKEEALPLGAKLLEQEAELDRLFASRSVTPESLKTATVSIAATQGALRVSHLKYHLATVPLLTAAQMQRYSELRGYAGHNAQPTHHHN